jgi:hypothetical protein
MIRQSDIMIKVLLRWKVPELRKKRVEGFADVKKLIKAVERNKKRKAER